MPAHDSPSSFPAQGARGASCSSPAARIGAVPRCAAEERAVAALGNAQAQRQSVPGRGSGGSQPHRNRPQGGPPPSCPPALTAPHVPVLAVSSRSHGPALGASQAAAATQSCCPRPRTATSPRRSQPRKEPGLGRPSPCPASATGTCPGSSGHVALPLRTHPHDPPDPLQRPRSPQAPAPATAPGSLPQRQGAAHPHVPACPCPIPGDCLQCAGAEGGRSQRIVYSCQLCPFASHYSSHLKRHMKTHNGEKPFACPQCAYASAQLVNLTRHLRTHTGENQDKPFQCAACDYRCNQSRNLKRHMLSHRLPEGEGSHRRDKDPGNGVGGGDQPWGHPTAQPGAGGGGDPAPLLPPRATSHHPPSCQSQRSPSSPWGLPGLA
uniref:C2H2-type domain-containing protein n=1 Tax=Apteryx owenii TaxID=8824 RepID=A0A8B9PPP5_APTOW